MVTPSAPSTCGRRPAAGDRRGRSWPGRRRAAARPPRGGRDHDGRPLPRGRRRRHARAEPAASGTRLRSRNPTSGPAGTGSFAGRSTGRATPCSRRGTVLEPRGPRAAGLGRRSRGPRDPEAAGGDRPDRRRAGRTRPGPRTRADPQLQRGRCSRAWRSPQGPIAEPLPDRPRRARGPRRDPLARAGVRRAADHRRRLRRPARPGPRGARGAGRRARVFHKVRLKPGKPLWFGVGPGTRRPARARSSSGCPATRSAGWSGSCSSSGRPSSAWRDGPRLTRSTLAKARLGREFVHRGDRPTYHPARWVQRPARLLDAPASSSR